jgi:hypothetical protein
MAHGQSTVAPLVIAILFAAIGGTLLWIGIGRPAWAWQSRKIQALVEAIGDGPASFGYIALGAALVAGALWILIKGR